MAEKTKVVEEAPVSPSFDLPPELIELERNRLVELDDKEFDLIERGWALQKKLKKSPPPEIDVELRGEINTIIGEADRAFRKSHPGMSTRFAFAPQNRSLHSGVIKHKARGYDVVTVKDLKPVMGDAAELYGGDDDPVRVWDTILMKTPHENKKKREKLLADRAEASSKLSEQIYKDSLEKAGRSPDGSQGLRAVGGLKQTVKQHDLIVPEEKEDS